MTSSLCCVVLVLVPVYADERIDLTEWARVVQFTGDTPQAFNIRELERGRDGWETWVDEDGQAAIGVEWDEPREIAEVAIEFRHAIADRDLVRVEYWSDHGDPYHGRWMSPQSEWWAGDRDVNFKILPLENQAGADGRVPRWPQTFRLQFKCGERELPPVRYIRAYGPRSFDHATFHIDVDDGSALKKPLMISTVNGHVLAGDGSTTLTESRLPESGEGVTIRYAAEERSTNNRTIVTIRSGVDETQGFSFLPAEVVHYGIIRIPALGATVVHEGAGGDTQAGLNPGACIYDRVFEEPEQTLERARREIPAPKKFEPEREIQSRPDCRRILPLGPPRAQVEIGVDTRGGVSATPWSIHPWMSMGKLEPRYQGFHLNLAVRDAGASEGLKDEDFQQSFDAGYLPIITTHYRSGGIACAHTSVSTFLRDEGPSVRGDETVVLITRIQAHNASDAPSKLEFTLTSGVKQSERFSLEGADLWATGAAGYKWEETYESRRFRCRLELPRDMPARLQGDSAVRADCELEPGETRTIEIKVPYPGPADEKEMEALATLTLDDVITRERSRWQAIFDRTARFQVPEPLLNDFASTQLAHLLISADRAAESGIWLLPERTGGEPTLRTSCRQIRTLDLRGMHDEAESMMSGIGPSGYRDMVAGRFTDDRGLLSGWPAYERYPGDFAHGVALGVLAEHYLFTRDQCWLRDHADMIVAACDFAIRERRAETDDRQSGHDAAPWTSGLLPACGLRGANDWALWFKPNAEVWQAMHLAGRALAEIGHPDAERIASEAAAYGSDIRSACREAMLRAPVARLRDGSYVPQQPPRFHLRRSESDTYAAIDSHPIHLLELGVYEPDSAEAEWILRDLEDNGFLGGVIGRELSDTGLEWFSFGGMSRFPGRLPTVPVYLRRGQPKHAVRAFCNTLAARLYEDVPAFADVDTGLGACSTCLYHVAAETAVFDRFRSMLILEADNDLHLLAGVPEAWLEPGKTIRIERAASWYGPIDLSVESRDEPRELVVRLGPLRDEPPAIRLHLRTGQAIRSVSLDGRSFDDFDPAAGVVALRGMAGRITLRVSY